MNGLFKVVPKLGLNCFFPHFFSPSEVNLVVCLRLLSFSITQVCLSFRAKLMSGHFSGKGQNSWLHQVILKQLQAITKVPNVLG